MAHYRLYKEGTSQIVDWLGRTASQYGYFGGAEPIISFTTSYSVTANELIELAGYIAANTRGTIGPGLLRIIRVLGDVIALRSKWSHQYQQQLESHESNQKHQHFIHVLEQVHEYLTQARQKERATFISDAPLNSQSTSPQKSSHPTVANMFEHLHIEECEEVDSQSVRSEPTRAIVYRLHEADNGNEMDVKIMAFFDDFDEVREHINSIWQSYASGHLDLPTVSLVTDAAIEMLDRDSNEFVDSITKDGNALGYSDLVKFIYGDIHMNWEQFVGDIATETLAEYLCFPVYAILNKFVIALAAKSDSDFEAASHEIKETRRLFQLRTESNATIGLWAYAQTIRERLIIDLFFNYKIMLFLKDRLPVHDHFGVGLCHAIETCELPIWLVLASTLHLDIHNIMRQAKRETAMIDADAVSRHLGPQHALHELQQVGLVTAETVKFYQGNAHRWLGPSCSRSLDILLNMTEEWVLKDPFVKSLKAIWALAQLEMERVMERPGDIDLLVELSTLYTPYDIQINNPVWCGLLSVDINSKLQLVGTLLADGSSVLLAVAHLYNAIRQECKKLGEVFPAWPDMDAVINFQGVERMFVGDFPTASTDYGKRMMLAMGFRITSFAKNRRSKAIFEKHKLKDIRSTIQASSFTEAIEASSRAATGYTDRVSTSNALAVLCASQSKVPKSRSSAGAPSQTSVEYLTALGEMIQAAMPEMNFNYITFNARVVGLLRDIQKSLNLQTTRDEEPLSFVVLDIFRMGHGKMNPRLIAAGEILREFIEKEGSVEVNKPSRWTPVETLAETAYDE